MVSWNSTKITNYLLYEKTKYKTIKNDNASNTSWWLGFAYPAKPNVNNEFERIPGFISCFRCMNTQIYNNSTGTKRFKEHADKSFPLSNTTISSSLSIAFALSSTLSSQTTLNQSEFIQKGLNLWKTIPQKLKIYQWNGS